MGVGIAKNELKDLQDEQKRLRGCADGSFPGLMSTHVDKQDIDGSSYRSYEKEVKDAQEYAKACYDYAARRDLKYCSYGRKVMRCMAIAGRMQSVFTRGKALACLEMKDKK